jgi:CHAD domain-containing protein
MNGPSNVLAEAAAAVVAEQRVAADRALRGVRRKPRSAKRIHRARKALSRLLATIEDFYACIDDATHLFDRANALRKVLGRVRDGDVHLARLREYDRAASPEERCVIQTLRKRIRRRRRKARRKLAMLLDAAAVPPCA